MLILNIITEIQMIIMIYTHMNCILIFKEKIFLNNTVVVLSYKTFKINIYIFKVYYK